MGSKVIDSFTGEYAFLSNFYHSPLVFTHPTTGTVYSFDTVEHGYQAAKAGTEPELEDKIFKAKTPSEAKKLGKTAKLPADWEEIKLDVMLALVWMKFTQHPELAQKLIDTGDAQLVEGNWWGDKFWGVCNGEGLNILGELLMAIREELLAKPEGKLN